MSSAPHPFYPTSAILPGFVANDWLVGEIFAVFGVSLAVLAVATCASARRARADLGTQDMAVLVWFVLTGAIHLLIEGYFSINHARMPQMTDYMGQGWKEYSLSDSRYMTVDSFLVCMESVTAFAWGPLSLLTALLILKSSPWRHPVQALVSSGQFYGNFLYYSTNLYECWRSGVSYSRPETYYYWSYFVCMNAVWIVLPGYCIYQSMTASAAAFQRPVPPQIKATEMFNGAAKEMKNR